MLQRNGIWDTRFKTVFFQHPVIAFKHASTIEVDKQNEGNLRTTTWDETVERTKRILSYLLWFPAKSILYYLTAPFCFIGEDDKTVR